MVNKVKFGLEKVHIAFLETAQTEKIEITDVPTSDGDVTITVTADTLLGVDSPHDVIVPLSSTTHNSVGKVASAIVDALNFDDVISDVFRAWHDGGVIYLATLVAQDNDSTLEIAFDDTGTTSAAATTSEAVENGTTGYAEPKHVPGAVNLSVDPEGDDTEFYADNTKYFTYSTNNGYTGDLELADVPDEIKAEMLGMTIDNDGMLVESANDDKKEFALLFEVKGDEKDRRMVYYRCKANRPSQENSTNESGVTPVTDALPIEMLPTEDADKLVKGKLQLSDTNQAAFDSFFDSVRMPNVA